MKNNNQHLINLFINLPKDASVFYDAYCFEIDHYKKIIKDAKLQTIYISSRHFSDFSSSFIDDILNDLKSFIAFDPFIEIGIEVSANAVSPSSLKQLSKIGFSRISFCATTGLESLYIKKLVKEAGKYFPSINIDIVMKDFSANRDIELKRLLECASFKTPHLSVYGIETHSEFQEIRTSLEKFGYSAYDPFHFSIKNKECRYLQNILRYDDYIGIGPSAHGCLNVNGQKHHTANFEDVSTWVTEIEKKLILTPLSNDDVLEEFLLQNLTLIDGIDFNRFEEFFDEKMSNFFDITKALLETYNGTPVLMQDGTSLKSTENTHEAVARAAYALINHKN